MQYMLKWQHWPLSYNSMGCPINLPHESLSMNKTDTCVGTVMASFRGCSIWPQLVGAADSAGRLPRKASTCGRTDDRVCSSAVRLTKAPRRCSRMSLIRDRSALTPSQSASILLACTKNQVHKSAYVCCKPVVVYVHNVRSIMQVNTCDHAVSAFELLEGLAASLSHCCKTESACVSASMPGRKLFSKNLAGKAPTDRR